MEPIVADLGLGDHLAQLCDGSSQIALVKLCQTQAHAAVARVESVTDRVGEVASFFGGRARAIGSAAAIAAFACQVRIWLSRHRSSNSRASSIASAKYTPATSAL